MFDPEDFEETRPLVMARALQVNGHQLRQGSPIHVMPDETGEPGEITADQAARLWAGGTLIYADRALATPVETPERYAARVTEVDELEGGKFLIRAPWLGEGEEVSADKLDARRQEVIDLGVQAHRELIESFGPTAAVAVIAGTDGFLATDKGNGNYEITGPGLSEPLKVRGKANAEDKIAELRTEAALKTQAETDAGGNPGTAEVIVPAGEQGGLPVTDAATGAGGGTAEPAAEGANGDAGGPTE